MSFNPYQAPQLSLEEQERGIRIVKSKTLPQIVLPWGLFFILCCGISFGQREPVGAGIAALAALAGAAAQWTYWRRKDDRIRAANVLRFEGKAPLWGGLAERPAPRRRDVRRGYLLLTVDALIFTTRLDSQGPDAGELRIPLDEITAMKRAGRSLKVWTGGPERQQVFSVRGVRDWHELLTMACRLRAERRSAGASGR